MRNLVPCFKCNAGRIKNQWTRIHLVLHIKLGWWTKENIFLMNYQEGTAREAHCWSHHWLEPQLTFADELIENLVDPKTTESTSARLRQICQGGTAVLILHTNTIFDTSKCPLE